MKNAYIDRSLTTVEEWKANGDELFALERQTRYAIEEATAKNLLIQAKLRESLKEIEPQDAEAIEIEKAIDALKKNWQELNKLYEQISWRPPQPWEEIKQG